jgi:hypothetical protein
MNGEERISVRAGTSLAEHVRVESFLLPEDVGASRATSSEPSYEPVNHRGTWPGLIEMHGQPPVHAACE